MSLEDGLNKQEEGVTEQPENEKIKLTPEEQDEKYLVQPRNKQEQTGSDDFTVNNGLLKVDIGRIVSNRDGLITFEASQVDNSDTATAFKGGLSRDIRYAVFKQGDQVKVQKIFNPKGAEFVQGVRGEEAEAVLKSPTVMKYLS